MMQTYELLVQLREQYHNLRIKFNFVYQESNEDNIIDMTKEYDKNYTFDRFQLVYPHGPDFIKKKVDKLAYDKFYRLSVEMQKHMRFVRRSDIHSLVFRAIRFPRDEVMHKAVEEGDMGRRCHAGKRIVVLDDIGNVYPCEPLWHPVGNVRKTNYCIRAILNSKEMQEFKKKYLGPNKCNCTWGCTVLDSIIFNPIYYPKILYYMGYLTFFGGKGIQKSEVFNKKSRS
jgi:radical SAM protein with 4Fe4S-binding SPASM domain